MAHSGARYIFERRRSLGKTSSLSPLSTGMTQRAQRNDLPCVRRRRREESTQRMQLKQQPKHKDRSGVHILAFCWNLQA